METAEMEQQYYNVANLVNKMIPESWSRLYLYAEVDEEGGTVFFYYYPEGKEEPIYSHDILKQFEFPEKDFRTMNFQLYKYFRALRQEFIEKKQEPWTNLTFFLQSDGSFKIEYSYEDLSEANDVETEVIWAYKHMGVIPKDMYHKSFLDNYLRNQDDNK